MLEVQPPPLGEAVRGGGANGFVANGLVSGNGTVFQMTPAGVLTTLVIFLLCGELFPDIRIAAAARGARNRGER